MNELEQKEDIDKLYNELLSFEKDNKEIWFYSVDANERIDKLMEITKRLIERYEYSK